MKFIQVISRSVSAGFILAVFATVTFVGCGVTGSDDVVPVNDLATELESAASGVGTPDDPAVFVKSGQDTFHTNGCKWLSRGRPGVDSMTKSEALAAGYTPCPDCQPQQD